MAPTFPADCVALIVEQEPVQALVIDAVLAEIGCRTIGLVGSV
jgi:hypothetical protein